MSRVPVPAVPQMRQEAGETYASEVRRRGVLLQGLRHGGARDREGAMRLVQGGEGALSVQQDYTGALTFTMAL